MSNKAYSSFLQDSSASLVSTGKGQIKGLLWNLRTREGHCRNEDVWASSRMCKAIKKRWTNKGKEVMIYIIRKMIEEGKRPIY